MRRAERAQKVSFAWLRQQFEFGHFHMLNADAREQVADRFPKPFTDRTKSQRALRLIARSDAFRSFHTCKVARGNPKPAEPTATPAAEAIQTCESMAAALLKSKGYSDDALEKVIRYDLWRGQVHLFEQCRSVTSVRDTWHLARCLPVGHLVDH